MTGTLISAFLIISGLNICFSQTKKTNLEILEQDIQGELEKFFYYPDLNRGFQFVFYVTSAKKDKSEKKFIESVIKKASDKNKLKISFAKDEKMLSDDSAYNKARIDIRKLKTEYPKFGKNKFLGEKSIERRVTSELAIEIKQNNRAVIVEDNISTTYKDDIPYDNYEQYQTDEYSFTQSVPPDISLLESIIFPAAVITVSAVAAILFFTIRSK